MHQQDIKTTLSYLSLPGLTMAGCVEFSIKKNKIYSKILLCYSDFQ